MQDLAPVDVREAPEQLEQEEAHVVGVQAARVPLQILGQV